MAFARPYKSSGWFSEDERWEHEMCYLSCGLVVGGVFRRSAVIRPVAARAAETDSGINMSFRLPSIIVRGPQTFTARFDTAGAKSDKERRPQGAAMASKERAIKSFRKYGRSSSAILPSGAKLAPRYV